jgi:hypothetical protein
MTTYNRSQTYTVVNRNGDAQESGLTVAEAAQLLLCYDGHEYEVRPESDGNGFRLWVSNFSRNSMYFNGLTKSRIWSLQPDEQSAEAEIFRKVVKHSLDYHGCTVMTDAEHAYEQAKIAAELAAENAE